MTSTLQIRFTVFASVALCGGLTPGCALLSTHQAKLDQVQLRETLMDYVDAQIMDNLIRARNGLPIVHYDFSHVGGVVADKLPVTIAGGQVLSDTPRTAMAAAARAAMRPFTISASPERDNTIDVEVLPITSEKQIYAAYVEFLSALPDGTKRQPQHGTVDSEVTTTTRTDGNPTEAKTELKSFTATVPIPGFAPWGITIDKPTGFTVVTTPPKASKVTVTVRSGAVDFDVDFDRIRSVKASSHPPENPEDVLFGEKRWINGSFHYAAKKWIDGNYYWVPKEYKKAFFRLCLATVARGYASPSKEPDAGGGKPPANATRTLSQQNEDIGSSLRAFQNTR